MGVALRLDYTLKDTKLWNTFGKIERTSLYTTQIPSLKIQPPKQHKRRNSNENRYFALYYATLLYFRDDVVLRTLKKIYTIV